MRRITKRFVLHVGFSCNERCRFCYYRESLEKGLVKDLTLKEIKKRLRIGRKYGKNEVDLSGGEPTIRKDLPEIIKYAKSIGYKTVCIITNGIRMSNMEYCKALIGAGLNDVLVSLHSVREETHDYLTRTPGSWKKLRDTMKNLKKFKVPFRINSVINNLNFQEMNDYFKYVKQFKPKAINLLIFNPAEECMSYKNDKVNIVDYNIISKNLIIALDKYSKDFERINIRFLPFCLLKGHEEKIRTMWQKIYEREEWDPYLFMRFRKNNWYMLMSFIVGFFKSFPRKIPFYGKKKIYTFLCEVIQAGRIFYNKKQTKYCKKCSLKKICPGLPRAYVKKFNKTKLHPYSGKIIEDPLYFCPELKVRK